MEILNNIFFVLYKSLPDDTHTFSEEQYWLDEHVWVQVVGDWQVFEPPATVSLQAVVPVKDSQSKFEMQYTEI